MTTKNDDIEVSVATLAGVFACDERTIRGYAERKIAVRAGRGRYYLKSSTRNLIEHLRDTAAGRGGADGVQSLTAERARLAREQADGHALKNKIARGELIETAAVEARWSDICAQIRARLLAIPTIYCADVPTATRAEIDILDRLIREALTGLADELAKGNETDD